MDQRSPPLKWNKKEEKLRDQFPDLQEEDLNFEEGNQEQLISQLQNKLGKSRNEVKLILKRL